MQKEKTQKWFAELNFGKKKIKEANELLLLLILDERIVLVMPSRDQSRSELTW